jgi:hypothetical protein
MISNESEDIELKKKEELCGILCKREIPANGGEDKTQAGFYMGRKDKDEDDYEDEEKEEDDFEEDDEFEDEPANEDELYEEDFDFDDDEDLFDDDEDIPYN